MGGSVRVVFEVENVEIAPAGTMESGTGHHHLLVNTDLTPEGQPIPATEGVHVHFGRGQTEYEMTDLAPGDYTIIAVVADGVHIRFSRGSSIPFGSRFGSVRRFGRVRRFSSV